MRLSYLTTMLEAPKPSALRNYLYEYALLALCSVVIALSFAVKSLYNTVIGVKDKQIELYENVIQKNTNTLQEFNRLRTKRYLMYDSIISND